MKQCEYLGSFGQCPKPAIASDRFCEEHTAQTAQRKIGAYLIANRYIGEPAERHAESDKIKSLVGEIAILRAMLERRLNSIDNDAEFMSMGAGIKDMALAIDKLVVSWHTMDVKLGNLLNKQALMCLAQDIIGIIEENVRPLADSHPTTADVDNAMEAIANAIVESIAKQENSKEIK
jgi:hypothetical protein